MKTPEIIRRGQLERFARFLDEHPCFSPALTGADALLYGFHVGECFLMVQQMEALISSRPHFAGEAEHLLAPSGVWSRPPSRSGKK